jgi:predicted TIM-barrel fold metal-dependent hydrolase
MSVRRDQSRASRREGARLAAVVLVLVAGCGRSGCAPARGADAGGPGTGGYRRIDAHAHIMPASSSDALEFYRRSGVDVAINVSGRYPGGGQEQVIAASRASQGRLHFMCNILWDAPVDHPDFVRFAISSLEQCLEQGGVGWKIPKVLGLGAVYSDGSLVPVDARELDPVFERAGELGLPVLIHSGDPQAFFEPTTPENERYEELRAHPAWSFAGPEFPSWEEVFAQYERRVARHPDVTFIGAHFGNAPEEPARVARMLDRYPNLWIDTAARVPEIGRHDPRELHDFFVRYQDRILFATDLGYGRDMLGRLRIALGSSGEEPPTEVEIQRFWASTYRYFETSERGFPNPTPIQGRWAISGVGLPRDVLEKIYHANAERLFHISLPQR